MRLASHFLEHVAPKLEEFKSHHEAEFQGIGEVGGDSGDGVEYELKMTDLYNIFCNIFESGMEGFLDSRDGIPKNHLWRIVKKGVDDLKRGEGELDVPCLTFPKLLCLAVSSESNNT